MFDGKKYINLFKKMETNNILNNRGKLKSTKKKLVNVKCNYFQYQN